MTFADALGLGRVSNLPTVWTNMLTGVVLAGGTLDDARAWLLAAALSLFYIAGMYLNDAFDADIDAVERPERPIPAGRVRRSSRGRRSGEAVRPAPNPYHGSRSRRQGALAGRRDGEPRARGPGNFFAA